MNNELYRSIKNELNSLNGEQKEPNNVSNLLGKMATGKKGKELFTVIYAFYEYMNNQGFSFISEQKEWADFFQNNFSNYFTMNIIKSDFDDIVSNERLLNTILKVCNLEVKNNLYKYAKIQNALYTKTGSNRYVNVYKKIEDTLINDGIIENSKENEDYLESKKLESNKKRVLVDPSLVSGLKSKSEVVATTTKAIYEKIKEKTSSFKFFKNLKLEILDNDRLSTLTIVKKEDFFDKIASSDNEYVRKIYNSAKTKLELFKSLAKPGLKTQDFSEDETDKKNSKENFANRISNYGVSTEDENNYYVDEQEKTNSYQ